MADRTQLHMFRSGALTLAELGSTFGAKHRALGLKSEDWALWRQDEAWNAEEAVRAFDALPRLMDASVRSAGVLAMPLTAEYIGAVLCQVVRPINWRVAAAQFQGLDGRKLIAPNGDDVSSREYVSPARLFALMLAHYQDVPASIPVEPADKVTLDGVAQDGTE